MIAASIVQDTKNSNLCWKLEYYFLSIDENNVLFWSRCPAPPGILEPVFPYNNPYNDGTPIRSSTLVTLAQHHMKKIGGLYISGLYEGCVRGIPAGTSLLDLLASVPLSDMDESIPPDLTLTSNPNPT